MPIIYRRNKAMAVSRVADFWTPFIIFPFSKACESHFNFTRSSVLVRDDIKFEWQRGGPFLIIVTGPQGARNRWAERSHRLPRINIWGSPVGCPPPCMIALARKIERNKPKSVPLFLLLPTLAGTRRKRPTLWPLNVTRDCRVQWTRLHRNCCT